MSIKKFRLVLLSLGSCKGRRGREGSFTCSLGRTGNNSLNSLAGKNQEGLGWERGAWSPPQPKITQASVRNRTRGAWSCMELLQGWAAAPVPPSKSQGAQLVGRGGQGPSTAVLGELLVPPREHWAGGISWKRVGISMERLGKAAGLGLGAGGAGAAPLGLSLLGFPGEQQSGLGSPLKHRGWGCQ